MSVGTEEEATSAPASRLRHLARLEAVLAIVAALVLLAAVVVFVFRNGAYIALGLAGFVIGIAGGWTIVSQRGVRRILGLLVVLAGAALIVFGTLGAHDPSWSWLLKVVLCFVLLGVAVTAARAAVLTSLRSTTSTVGSPVPPPTHPVLLCNPWSGGGKVERFGLRELASSLGIDTVTLDHDSDLGDLARAAAADGADCLGMAGGDGSQALVASIATECGLPFVCVSAGTRNHFALDLGLDRDDPRKSVHAFHDAIERRVDYATVNGRFFVNNVSLGVYATIVQREEYRDAKLATSARLLPELLGARTEPFDLQFTTPDGTHVDGAFLLQVSNNPYVLNASPDVSQRRSMSTGTLGVFAVTASSGLEAADAVSRTLAGLSAAPVPGPGSVYQFTCTEFEVTSRSGRVFAGIDGEALELETPLRFQIHPGGLVLLVPRGNLDAALRRQARDVHVRDLIGLALGRAAPD